MAKAPSRSPPAWETMVFFRACLAKTIALTEQRWGETLPAPPHPRGISLFLSPHMQSRLRLWSSPALEDPEQPSLMELTTSAKRQRPFLRLMPVNGPALRDDNCLAGRHLRLASLPLVLREGSGNGKG